MVARTPIAGTVSRGVLSRLFQTWRVILTRLVDRIAPVRKPVAQPAITAPETSAASVADPSPGARPGSILSDFTGGASRLFSGWRRVVSRAWAAAAPADRLRLMTETIADTARFLREPATLAGLAPHSADRVASLGVRSLLLGMTATAALGWAVSGSPGVPLASAFGMLAWAAARLAILMALATPRSGSRVLVFSAWACSLLPFAVGATDLLRMIALAVSAWLCLGALRALDEPESSARTMVAWAFGGQAAVITAGWLLRGGIAAVFSLL